MYIWGAEKTPASASTLAADFLIAVSEGKLFHLSGGLTGQLCLYAVLTIREPFY